MDLRVKRRNLSVVICQPNLFLNFPSKNKWEHMNDLMNFRAKRSYFMVKYKCVPLIPPFNFMQKYNAGMTPETTSFSD